MAFHLRIARPRFFLPQRKKYNFSLRALSGSQAFDNLPLSCAQVEWSPTPVMPPKAGSGIDQQPNPLGRGVDFNRIVQGSGTEGIAGPRDLHHRPREAELVLCELSLLLG